MKRFRQSLAFVLSLAVPVLALAHSGNHNDPVRYRQSGYYLIGWHFAPMAAMIKGERPMDTQDFAKHAHFVAEIAAMLPEGFANGPHKGTTDAKPEIWKNPEDFAKKMKAFQDQSAQLAQTAQGGDATQIKSQFLKTAETCKACHDDYRKE